LENCRKRGLGGLQVVPFLNPKKGPLKKGGNSWEKTFWGTLILGNGGRMGVNKIRPWGLIRWSQEKLAGLELPTRVLKCRGGNFAFHPRVLKFPSWRFWGKA